MFQMLARVTETILYCNTLAQRYRPYFVFRNISQNMDKASHHLFSELKAPVCQYHIMTRMSMIPLSEVLMWYLPILIKTFSWILLCLHVEKTHLFPNVNTSLLMPEENGHHLAYFCVILFLILCSHLSDVCSGGGGGGGSHLTLVRLGSSNVWARNNNA